MNVALNSGFDHVCTNHQNRRYHAVHLTRSSPAPTISSLSHLVRVLLHTDAWVSAALLTYLLTYCSRVLNLLNLPSGNSIDASRNLWQLEVRNWYELHMGGVSYRRGGRPKRTGGWRSSGEKSCCHVPHKMDISSLFGIREEMEIMLHYAQLCRFDVVFNWW